MLTGLSNEKEERFAMDNKQLQLDIYYLIDELLSELKFTTFIVLGIQTMIAVLVAIIAINVC